MDNVTSKAEPHIFKGLYTDYAEEGASLVIFHFLIEHQALFDEWLAQHQIDPKGGLNRWFTNQKWRIDAQATLTQAFEEK